MNPNAQKDLLLSTDYPLDIAILIEGQQAIPSGASLVGDNGWYSFYIDTGQTDQFIILPTFSFNSDFSDQFFSIYGAGIVPLSGFWIQPNNNSMGTLPIYEWNMPDPLTTIVRPGLHIRLSSVVGITAPARTLYYRFALIPAADNQIVPFNSSQQDTFNINTDNNYLKLFSKGTFNTSSESPPFIENTGLGHSPLVIPFMTFDYSQVIGFPPDSVSASNFIGGYISPPGGFTGNIMSSKDDGSISVEDVAIQIPYDTTYRVYIDE